MSAGADVVAAVRHQGEACAALGSPMYAELCAHLADDLAAGGVSAELVGTRSWAGPDAVALRILGGVHRLVLERRAGALAAFYPSVGGRWAAGGWAAFLEVLTAHSAELAAAMSSAPQTNEIGRGAALVGGLALVGEALPRRQPIELYEIGASAGLLLRADLVRYVGADGKAIGPSDATLVVDDAWESLPVGATSPGPGDPGWPVVGRHGCDVNPIDATSGEGRLGLSAYCWPDQTVRWERLRGALAIAAEVPVDLQRRDAGDFVDDLRPRPDVLSVLWHSVMWQYLPAATQDRISARIAVLLEEASASAPFVHLSVEPRRLADGRPFVIRFRAAWGSGIVEGDLGTTAAHGVPCSWTARAR